MAESTKLSVEIGWDSKGVISALDNIQNKIKEAFKPEALGLPGPIAGVFGEMNGIFTKSMAETLVKVLGFEAKMKELAQFLSQFSAYVQSSGLSAALTNLLPPELTAAIFAVSGAIIAAAIPAFGVWALTVAETGIALLPFITAGLALGTAIWALWDAVSTINEPFEQWKMVMYTIAGALAGAAIPGILSFAISLLTGAIPALIAFATSVWAAVAPLLPFMVAGAAVAAIAYVIVKAWKPLGDLFNATWQLITSWTKQACANMLMFVLGFVKKALEVVKPVASIFGSSVSKSIDGWLDKTGKAYDLAQKSAQEAKVSGTAAQQAIGNAFKETVNALTSGTKVATDSASKIKKAFGGLTKKPNTPVVDVARNISEVKSQQQNLTQSPQTTSGTNEAPAPGETTETDNSDLNADMLADQQAYLAEKNKMNIAQSEYEDSLDEARKQGELRRFAELLSQEQALEAQNLAGRQAMIDAYYEIWKESHRTAMSYMAEGVSGLYSGLTTFFTDIINNTKSVGEAWSALKSSILTMLGQMVAKWIASQIMMAIFGKTMQTTAAGVSAATAAATATAWAPAAAMVSLASFGANSTAAMAGIGATYGLTMSLASIPAMASGGITTGPTLAQIGEGKYQEAVLPLSKRVFEKVGLVNGKQSQQSTNVHFQIQTIDAKSFEEALNNGLGNKLMKYVNAEQKSFAF